MSVNRKLLIVKHSVLAAKVEGKFVRQSGGRGQYGHVWVEFAPHEPGTGFHVREQNCRWCPFLVNTFAAGSSRYRRVA